jgi:hypothetical protein
MIRVHPAHPLWLRSDAALSHLPSLGPQMVGRLGVVGVRTVGDLIHLDPESATAVLQRLHVSTTQLRLWQAEARLLCCVPDLTGRDAQLLVLCGILGEQELAAASVDHVVERMERLQGVRSEGWLPSRGAWPTRETVQRWIRAAGAAREIPPRESALLPFSAEGTDDPAESPSASEFCLHVDRPVVDAPSIGPTTARRLERIGIQTVAQLLSCDPDGTAGRLRRSRISAEMIRAWQRQARLMCCVPGLRGHDAQVLVACGITEAADLRRISPSALYAMVRPFLETDEGRRALRSARTPDLAEVTAWVEAAQRTRALRAA